MAKKAPAERHPQAVKVNGEECAPWFVKIPITLYDAAEDLGKKKGMTHKTVTMEALRVWISMQSLPLEKLGTVLKLLETE